MSTPRKTPLADTAKSNVDERSQLASSTIMIVDDVPVNVKVVQAHLQTDGYHDFIPVTDGTEALSTLYRTEPDLVVLDIMMPDVSGLDILRAIRSDPRYSRLPVLILTGAEDRSLKREALELGATDFLMKPVDAEELLPRVRNVLSLKSYQDDLETKIRMRTLELETSRQELVYCLARAAEYRDNETGNHVIRVGCYVAIIAEELGMAARETALLQQAATLHDLGKIGIPDSILLKNGSLTPSEFEMMKDHCEFGRTICGAMSEQEFWRFAEHTTYGAKIMKSCSSPLMRMASTIALTHHEKWDGSGYPLGLAGEDIPLAGRITAVADVFDALSSRRPYKPAFPLNECFAIMEDERGKHFDPTVLDAFLARRSDIVTVQLRHADVQK